MGNIIFFFINNKHFVLYLTPEFKVKSFYQRHFITMKLEIGTTNGKISWDWTKKFIFGKISQISGVIDIKIVWYNKQTKTESHF